MLLVLKNLASRNVAAAAGAGGDGGGGGDSAPSSATCDAGLYADLLRRANGDQALVSLWLAEMGFKAEPSTAGSAQALVAAERNRGLRAQYGTSSDSGAIKAVPPSGGGSRAGALGTGGSGVLDSAWSSLAAVRGSTIKVDPLKSTPGELASWPSWCCAGLARRPRHACRGPSPPGGFALAICERPPARARLVLLCCA